MGILLSSRTQETGKLTLNSLSEKVSFSADSARIFVAISVTKDDKNEASASFSETTKSLRNLLKKYDIDEKNVILDNVFTNQYEEENFLENGEKIQKQKYTMTQDLEIALTGEVFQKMSNFLKDMTIVENISVTSVQKTLQNTDVVMQLAHKKLAESAKKQAENIASQMNKRLGDVLSFEITTPNDITQNSFAKAKMSNSDDMLGLDSENEFEVYATVSYELK